MRALAVLLLAMISSAASAECTVRSGPATNVLVELYTSEGCDSCPPADRWFSEMGRAGAGPERLIPIAFHVDYWDYLGWKDRFAKPLFSERQRSLAAAASSTRVYTPQVVVAGKDFYRWRDAAALSARLDAVARVPARAAITITSSRLANGKVAASIEAALPEREPRRDLAVYLALVESGLSSRVTAGENRGELLRHDHVVRDLAKGPGLAFASSVEVKPDWNIERQAWVGFVQDLRNGEILQALQAPACRS